MPVNSPLDLGRLQTELEQAEQPWSMAYTSMTGLTEESRVLRLGVPPTPGVSVAELDDDLDERTAAAHAAGAESVGAPAAFDLRDHGGADYTTRVKDQGDCGSCVAFAVISTMEHVVRFTNRTAGLTVDLSEAHLFYCHGGQDGASCVAGWWPAQALPYCRDAGVAFDDCFPYVAGDQDCSRLNADWPNRMAKVARFQDISGDAAAMKEHIAAYGAVSACLDVYQDFFSYGGGVYRHVTGAYAGGHCVSLVGYDDAAGCWIAKNSWGRHWGDQGFFKIAYGQCRVETYQTCSVSGVTLRGWLPDQRILGLWSNEADGNVWAYGSVRGWLKLDGADATTGEAMLLELAASKALGTPVGLYEDGGTVHQIYAW
ncbi:MULTISPECIES: C1 family peptidase [Nonomuraea]|uniref:C1 family peptidase n=1 Tax=Nonomuraea ferruginea TaxID=46174 RepID=A0ABT4SYJ0_9ACTN|nr:C1 family peptidase [Nonomuraea ferruginea]MDA0642316.1 C1 family peptidase [Nonomuraea ferruginea]